MCLRTLIDAGSSLIICVGGFGLMMCLRTLIDAGSSLIICVGGFEDVFTYIN